MQNDFESIFILASSNRRRIKLWNHNHIISQEQIIWTFFFLDSTILPFQCLSDIQTNVDKSPKTQWRFVAFHWRSAELAIIISYPTSACEIIVLLKHPQDIRQIFSTLFCEKKPDVAKYRQFLNV
mgnify:CR=1 FL=1